MHAPACSLADDANTFVNDHGYWLSRFEHHLLAADVRGYKGNADCLAKSKKIVELLLPVTDDDEACDGGEKALETINHLITSFLTAGRRL